MAKTTYYALLDPVAGGYEVTFPDLDGCAASGVTADEAVSRAHAALSLHLEQLVEEAREIPAPSNLSQLATVIAKRYFERKQPTAYHAVSVEMPDQGERVNIYLDRSLLERIDALCAEIGINRSAFFTLAARAYTGATPKQDALLKSLAQASEQARQVGFQRQVLPSMRQPPRDDS